MSRAGFLLFALFFVVQSFAGTDTDLNVLKTQFSANGFANPVITVVTAKDLYDKASLDKAQYYTNLTFVMVRNTSWTKDIVMAHLKEMARIYNTDDCRVLFRSVYIVEVDPYKGYTVIDWASVYPAPPNAVDLQIAKQLPAAAPRPTIVLMQASAQGYSAYSGVAGAMTADNEALTNTIWVTTLIEEQGYKSRLPKGYDPIAHELTHILGNYAQHNTLPQANIMNDDFNLINDKILPEMCVDIEHSKLVIGPKGND